MQPDPMLALEDVTIDYAGLRAVTALSMVVPRGAVVALLGANGAGKTSTLRAISGLVRPSSGRILFEGVPIQRRGPHQIARMGVLQVPEGRGVFRSLSVRANLSLVSPSAVDEAVERFPALGRRIDLAAAQLSGGEQQMLALARAVLSKPKLLLLDEISMGLAPIIVSELFSQVRAMAEDGVTVLLVEQYVGVALEMADYAYVLDKGRVVDVGEPSDLRNDGVLASYLGG